jgi:hypothetical protein
MDRGTKFYEPTGETTEWEGIIAPKTKVKEEEEYGDDEEQIDPRHNATLDELDEMDVSTIISHTMIYYV